MLEKVYDRVYSSTTPPILHTLIYTLYAVFVHPSLKPMKHAPSIYQSKELFYLTIVEVCEEESRMALNKGLHSPETSIDLLLKKAHKPFSKNDSRMILEFTCKSSSSASMSFTTCTQPGWVFSLSRVASGKTGRCEDEKRIFATIAQGAQAMKISSGADYQGYHKRAEKSIALWVHKDALYRVLDYQDDEKYNNEPSEFRIRVNKTIMIKQILLLT